MTARIDDATKRSLTTMALAAVMVLLLSGCGNAPGGPDGLGAPDRVPTAEIVAAADCLAPNLDPFTSPDGLLGDTATGTQHPDAPPAGRVPANFEAVAAIRCTLNDIVDDAEGRWSAVTMETRGGSLDRLMSALAQSDDDRAMLCAAFMEGVSPLWLVDAIGQAIHVHYPRNGCGNTKPAVRDAFEALDVIESISLNRNLIEPRVAIDTGCAVQWTALSASWPTLTVPGKPITSKDGIVMIPMEQATAQPVVPTDALRWCRYVTKSVALSSDAAPENAAPEYVTPEFEGALTLGQGTFVAGGLLDAADTGRVYAEAVAAERAAARAGGEGTQPADPTCDTGGKTFMVLWPAGESEPSLESTLSVDLGGCLQLYRAGAEPIVLSVELIQLLAAAE